jgi:hypothetical protein
MGQELCTDGLGQDCHLEYPFAIESQSSVIFAAQRQEVVSVLVALEG